MSGQQSITLRGMTFAWAYANTQLHIALRAPTRGWVAIGFNQRNQLAGTNLIMGAILPNGTVHVQDRYIMRAGLHRAKAELGAHDRVGNAWGIENRNTTDIRFSLPITANDRYSYTLARGQQWHVLLAYSVDDDFMHHSRMRTHTIVQL